MIACFDVYYSGEKATAAAIVFSDWQSSSYESAYTASLSDVAKYEPGEFYLRELAPLHSVIDKIEQPIETFIMDGYCHLSADMRPGLGSYLQESLTPGAVIIGIAKNRYRDSQHAAEVIRGQSLKPLFVTSIGIERELAAENVRSMHGEFRIPTMLKAVDQLSRSGSEVDQ